MTNMEFYRDEIEKIIDGGLTTIAVKKDGTPVGCTSGTLCDECIFGRREYCSQSDAIKWLMSEHKDKPTITARERHFLEFVKTGWIVKDKNGDVWWFEEQPVKMAEIWDTFGSSSNITGLVKDTLTFIAWDDKEPWSVEELLKLEVQK